MGIKTFSRKLQNIKDNKRLGIHSFHRYFGKLIPAIPRFAIDEFTKQGDLVYDPFCGTGTTLVESKYSNRNSYGIDLNPLAVLASKVKVTPISNDKLTEEYTRLISNIKNDKSQIKKTEIPFCINIDHWYRDYVIRDLIKIKRHIDKIKDKDIKDFFLLCFSATNRNVSNADPMHVFPGYSKRLRGLDAEGKREIDVFESFAKLSNSRVKYMLECAANNNKSWSKPMLGDARAPVGEVKNVKLIVTNPPYISSIRYLETMKLEMYWMKYLLKKEDYFELDKKIIGTERYSVSACKDQTLTKYDSINSKVTKLFKNGAAKMSKVVADYFNSMDNVFDTFDKILVKDGYVVFKISDSLVRKVKIPTPDFFVEMLTDNHGFKLVDSFKDKFKNRSLLTKRNYYSGIIDHDKILILKKVR
jgi:hypothetical protein